MTVLAGPPLGWTLVQSLFAHHIFLPHWVLLSLGACCAGAKIPSFFRPSRHGQNSALPVRARAETGAAVIINVGTRCHQQPPCTGSPTHSPRCLAAAHCTCSAPTVKYTALFAKTGGVPTPLPTLSTVLSPDRLGSATRQGRRGHNGSTEEETLRPSVSRRWPPRCRLPRNRDPLQGTPLTQHERLTVRRCPFSAALAVGNAWKETTAGSGPYATGSLKCIDLPCSAVRSHNAEMQGLDSLSESPRRRFWRDGRVRHAAQTPRAGKLA